MKIAVKEMLNPFADKLTEVLEQVLEENIKLRFPSELEYSIESRTERLEKFSNEHSIEFIGHWWRVVLGSGDIAVFIDDVHCFDIGILIDGIMDNKLVIEVNSADEKPVWEEEYSLDDLDRMETKTEV